LCGLKFIYPKLKIDANSIRELRRHPSFAALVSAHAERALYVEGKSAAVMLLIDTARDKSAALQHRLRAAELILSRTMAPAAAAPADSNAKDINELSASELRALVDSMQEELAQRAEPIRQDGQAPAQIDGDSLGEVFK